MTKRTLAVGVEPPNRAQELVLTVIGKHSDALLRTARRYSLCADDAQEAYQRAMEIFLRRAHVLDEAGAASWVHRTVKHEALRVRTHRLRLVGSEAVDLDSHEARHIDGPEERFVGAEEIERAAEALQRLKPDEVRAMWLQALGRSYAQIEAETGWSRRKVSRCINEGRETFLARFAGIEAGEECARWAPQLHSMVDGEASRAERAELRPHLRNCRGCRATVRELRAAAPHLAAVFPAGGLVAAGASTADGGMLLRSYEAVTHFLQDKAATSAVKLQAAIDAVGSGKAAAVAASAAAVAGGGAAVVEHETRRPSTAKAVVAAPVRSPSPSRVVTRKAASAAPVATRAKREQVVRRPKQTAPQRRATGVRREFSSSTATKRRTTGEFTARRVVRTTAPAVPKPVTKPARGGAEFGF